MTEPSAKRTGVAPPPPDRWWTGSFFEGLGLHVVRDPEREKTAPLEAGWIARVLGLRPGDRLLDLPCGNGRIAIELARLEVRVTGVDATDELLSEARGHARSVKVPPVFRAGDMRDLPEKRRYEAAINWWGSFGYFPDEENRQVLLGLTEAVRPGGRVLVDAVNRQNVLRGALGRHDISWEDVRVLHDVAWDPATERLEGTWEIREGDRVKHAASSIRLYTPGQMRRLAEGVGLTRIRFYGDWMGTPYSRGSHRLVMLACRPPAVS